MQPEQQVQRHVSIAVALSRDLTSLTVRPLPPSASSTAKSRRAQNCSTDTTLQRAFDRQAYPACGATNPMTPPARQRQTQSLSLFCLHASTVPSDNQAITALAFPGPIVLCYPLDFHGMSCCQPVRCLVIAGPHQMLVRLSIDILGHEGAVGGAGRVLIRRQGVCAQLACQLDLVLNGTILHQRTQSLLVHVMACASDILPHGARHIFLCALVHTQARVQRY